MSYNAYEVSSASGQPIELYKWEHATEKYTYTSGQANFVYGGDTYVAAPIRRGAIQNGSGIARANISVEVAADNPVAQLFVSGPPPELVKLTVYRRHAADASAVVVWPRGRVLSCEWSGITATLHHEPVWTALRQVGLRRTWGAQCPHVFGGTACGVVIGDIDVSGVLTTVSGANVKLAEADAQADGWWIGGTLTHVTGSPVRTRRAMIMNHVGDTLTLHISLGLIVGDTVTITPGCPHTLTGCRNIINYGGFPWTPVKSPYGGTVVY
jgi:uncharacterized phage protein (TIGR02218 family)